LAKRSESNNSELTGRLIALRERWHRSPAVDVAKFVLLVAALIWLMDRGSDRLGYHWHWFRVGRYLLTREGGEWLAGPLLQGLFITFRIVGASLVFAFVFGLVSALMRLSGSVAARVLARGYLELVRNTPLLVQLFFVYFVLSPILGIGRFPSAVLALSLFEGAYASEIFRAGIVAVHKGQWEAAHSLGLGTFYTYTHVVLPQAVRRILPPLTSQAISLIKDSALVSTIAIYDLAMQAQAVVAETYMTFEIWFTVAAMYLVITVTLSLLVNAMEKRLAVSD
jgi:polar amino acid transport system permease protein